MPSTYSIEKLPFVEIPGISAEASQKIHQQCQDLLREAAKHPVGTEVGAICDMQGNRKWWKVGTTGEVRIPDVGYPHISIHNHPDGMIFSGPDIDHFIFSGDIEGIIVVGNNGKIYTAVKGNEYDGFEAGKNFNELTLELDRFVEQDDMKGYIESIRSFLRGGEQYGLRFIEKGTE